MANQAYDGLKDITGAGIGDAAQQPSTADRGLAFLALRPLTANVSGRAASGMSQAHALINLFTLIGPLVLGLVVALVVVNAGLHPFGTATLSIAMYAVGFALFFAAKVSVVRRGHLISFGSGVMSRRSRRVYRLGYTLMIGGAVLTVGLLVTEKLAAGGSPANTMLERAGAGAAAHRGTSEVPATQRRDR